MSIIKVFSSNEEVEEILKKIPRGKQSLFIREAIRVYAINKNLKGDKHD